MRAKRDALILVLILATGRPGLRRRRSRGGCWSSARARVISTTRSPPPWPRSTTSAASSGRWETIFRTDCTAITKKPLKWGDKNLDDFDAVAFFTDGDLDMDDSQKADLLSFVRDDGKGFIGIHSAAITFLVWPEYGKMLGGYFDGHPWGAFDAPLVVEDPAFPGMRHLPGRFTLEDEIYQIKDYSRKDVRVLLRLDAGEDRSLPQGRPSQGQDFAVIWARDYGKGRVLYNGLGHRSRGLGSARDPEDVARDGASGPWA